MTAAFVLVLAILLLVNVWVHLGLRQAHLVTGPVAALVLLLVARAAGLSWADLGLARDDLLPGLLYGAAAAGAIAVVYAVGVLVPVTRRAFHDTRYRMPMRAAVLTSLVTIPLGTVVFEEVAFRSVLWGMLEHERGTAVATAVSSALFGLWHVLPALDVARTSTAIRGGGGSGASAGAPDRARDGRVHGRCGARLRRAPASERQHHRPARPALGHQRPRGRGRRAGLEGQPAVVRAGCSAGVAAGGANSCSRTASRSSSARSIAAICSALAGRS